MRFFKLNREFNWKYILGEILLLFVGINLAIWFNNWNTSKNTASDKNIAITRITDEIKSNLQELDIANASNKLIFNGYNDYKKFFHGSTSEILVSPKENAILKKKYPNFFRIQDSIPFSNETYLYSGTTYIELDLPRLTEIAWETTRTISLAKEFNYDCLYELESMYNLQLRVQIEIDKAANALQARDMNQLINILEFLNQLGIQLDDSYKSMLINIENCN